MFVQICPESITMAGDSIGIPNSYAKRIKKLLLHELSKRGYMVNIKEETPAHTI